MVLYLEECFRTNMGILRPHFWGAIPTGRISVPTEAQTLYQGNADS